MPRRRASRRKRSRRTARGGGDKKPQYLNATLSVPASGTWSSTIAEVPLLNILTGGTKVLEILKVHVNRYGGSTNTAQVAIGSKNLNGASSGTYTFQNATADRAFMVTLAMNGTNLYYDLDLTDENGNGMLYPAQQFYVNANVSTNGDGMKVSILYRIKNATLQEYVGIINQYVVTQV